MFLFTPLDRFKSRKDAKRRFGRATVWSRVRRLSKRLIDHEFPTFNSEPDLRQWSSFIISLHGSD
jgi:hypothetical protein